MSPSREDFLIPASPVRWVVVEKESRENSRGDTFVVHIQQEHGRECLKVPVYDLDYETISIGDILDQAYRRSGWKNLTPTQT